MERREYAGSAAAVAYGCLAGCLTNGTSDSSSNAPKGCRRSDVTFTQESDVFTVIVDDSAVDSHVFKLTNGTECQIRIEPEKWQILRKENSEWQQVETGDGAESVSIPPGEFHQWSLSLSIHPTTGATTITYVFPDAEIPEGTYAFEVSGQLEKQTETRTFDRRLEFEIQKKEQSNT